MAKKMPRRLVVLSSSAIAAVYLAGYVTTRSADARLAQGAGGPLPGTSAAASARSNALSLPIQPGASSAPPGVAGASVAGQAVAGTLQDGTFRGTGTSRRGNVSVAVTVRDGRIADVSITGATTQYPISRIAALPGQVVARQSAQVDRVSGATYSATAFQQAVQQALAHATAGAAPAAGASQGSLPAQPPVTGQSGQPGQPGRPPAPAPPGQPQPLQPQRRDQLALPDRAPEHGRPERERERSFR